MTTSVKPLVLVADDHLAILKLMEEHLHQWGYRGVGVSDKVQLLRQLEKEQPVLLLLDLQFGEHNGVEVMRDLLQTTPELTVVMLTGHGSIDSAITAIKLGAYDYLTKPPDLARLQVTLRHVAEKQDLNQQIKRLEELNNPQDLSCSIWGDSPAISQLRTYVAGVSSTDATVLILGESGTGKELVARALHDHSQRRNGPFVPVNMAALPRELVESTLFGHEKGAFTGADQARVGCCGAADMGTLFLDEIGDMDLALQAKLLRFLQERTFQRVGSSKTQAVDVRIVAATNRDLQDRVHSGQFREDLYYRLQVVPVHVPSLRERRQDVPLLATRFLKRAAARHRKDITSFTSAALTVLSRHDWPGNVRQLENLVERLVILSRQTEIDTHEIPAEIRQPTSSSLPSTSGTAPDIQGEQSFSIHQVEKRAILGALHQAGGKVRHAAHLLGLGQATVYRKIKGYGIRLKDEEQIPLESGRV